MADETNQFIEPVTFKAGDILFNEGDSTYHFFVIQEGSVEVYKTAPGGERVVLATVGEGLSIGEFAMIDRQPRSATARALSEVKATKITEEAYQQLLAELPEWAVSVMKALVDRLRHTNEIVRKALTDSKAREDIAKGEYDTAVRVLPNLDDDFDDNDTPDLA